MPFEELMGPKIADSQFCLEILARKFHKDCSSRLSSEDQAMARAFQIMDEEHLYCLVAQYNYKNSNN